MDRPRFLPVQDVVDEGKKINNKNDAVKLSFKVFLGKHDGGTGGEYLLFRFAKMRKHFYYFSAKRRFTYISPFLNE